MALTLFCYGSVRRRRQHPTAVLQVFEASAAKMTPQPLIRTAMSLHPFCFYRQKSEARSSSGCVHVLQAFRGSSMPMVSATTRWNSRAHTPLSRS